MAEERCLRVGVVEDDAIIALDIKRRVQKFGYRIVMSAANAEEALRLAEQEHPDLVLMDIRIRGEADGVDTALILRKKFDIPVIFVTAYSDDGMRERADKASPLGYLVKPIRDSDLKKALSLAEERVRG